MGYQVSPSEIVSYLRCRRKWWYGNKKRMSPIRGSSTMYMGTMIHELLHALRISMPAVDMLKQLEKEAEDKYRAAFGFGWSPTEREYWWDQATLARAIVDYYLEHWGIQCPENVFGGVSLYSEQTFAVPIPGTDVELIGTMDAVLDVDSMLWVMDHKTHKHSKFRKREEIITDWQFLAYTWAARKLFGKNVTGIVYDGIWQSVPPSEFPILKSGQLSKSWARVKVFPPYRYAQAVQQYCETQAERKKYWETLQKLTHLYASDNTPYHCREWVDIGSRRLKEFERKLVCVVKEMFDDPFIYPNPQGSCWDCSFNDLCGAESAGDKHLFEQLVENNYKTGVLYGTTERMDHGERIEV